MFREALKALPSLSRPSAQVSLAGVEAVSVSLRVRPYSRDRDAAPVSACFAEIQVGNRAVKKIMLVNGRYQWETSMMLDQRTKRLTDAAGFAATVSSF
jgi:hypothetical protein